MPWFLAAQAVVIAVWIAIDIVGSTLRFDPDPFILLNPARRAPTDRMPSRRGDAPASGDLAIDRAHRRHGLHA
jgi:hypothetical protein